MSDRLSILQVHNKYRPGWGGEDTVVTLEADLLRRHGHKIECVSAWTGELEGAGWWKLAATGFGTVWSFRGYSAVKEAIRRHSPDILHVHNTFPLLSPSVFWAAAAEGIPVVQTLHNFRLTCANSLLLRRELPCQKCVGRFPWPALRYRCFRHSFWQTAAVTSQNVIHRCLGTFQRKVHAYIVLTDFSREVMLRSGLPQDRVFVKPNFSPEPGEPTAARLPRVVFAGIISHFKGLHLLLEAWTRLAPAEHQLMIFGDGPDRPELEARYRSNPNIVWCGVQPRNKVIQIIGESRWLALPSLAYENFPMAVLEAFSVGTPVIVPDHGAFATTVTNRKDGLLFSPGNTDSLTVSLGDALCATEADWREWSSNARQKYLSEYTDRANYLKLMSIYQQALNCFDASRPHTRGFGPPTGVAPISELRGSDF